MYKKANKESASSEKYKPTEPYFLIRPLKSYIDRHKLDEKPHRHEWQEILYVIKGEGKQKIDNETIELRENHFYLIAQGQVHDFIIGRNLEGYLIRFSNEILPTVSGSGISSNISMLFSNLWNINSIEISTEDTIQYNRLLQAMEHEYLHTSRFNEISETLRYVFLSLMIKLIGEIQSQIRINTPDNDNDKRLLMSYLILVNDNYSERHDLDFYICKLDIDLRKLRRLTKKYTGQSPKKLLVNRSMDEAKRMLQYSGMSLKEISSQLGYSDPSYFSKHFKLQYKLSPKQYRASFI